ncbi:hypothetical protein F4778DRAFT_298425 [Xylariomycetidae sp. FL2044]|nr:hypothetical protein F4778DRAFT_298425 [Xylariomycetidae sp. FL2044]
MQSSKPPSSATDSILTTRKTPVTCEKDSTMATTQTKVEDSGHEDENKRAPSQARSKSLPRQPVKQPIDNEQVQEQPDVVLKNHSLTMPLDGPKLQAIIRTIEADKTMCYKMRWYVARHVRKTFREQKVFSQQLYQRRTRDGHEWLPQPEHPCDKLISLRSKPLNRLDFEATRAHCGFRKDQPDWEKDRLTQILQTAYEQYHWSASVTNSNVDAILVEAGVDLSIFAEAEAEAEAEARAVEPDQKDWHTAVKDDESASERTNEPTISHSTSPDATNPRKDSLSVVQPSEEHKNRPNLMSESGKEHQSTYEPSTADNAHPTPALGAETSEPKTQKAQQIAHKNDHVKRRAKSESLHRQFRGLKEPVEKTQETRGTILVALQQENEFRERVLAQYKAAAEESMRNERKFRDEFMAQYTKSQESLLSEIQKLREGSCGSKKRKRCSQKQRKTKMRKSLKNVLKELDVDDSSSESSSGAGSD